MDIEIWEAWELTDEEDGIVLEGAAPDDLAGEVENTSHYDVKWAYEVDTATVVDRRIEIAERDAYFVEKPPQNVAEPIGHREAVELIEHRGLEASMGQMEGAWYFPLKNEVGVHFSREDDAGESYDTYRAIKNLSEDEKALVRGEWDALDSRDEKTIEELQAEIYEETTWARFESGITACWIRDITDYREIADRLDSNYQTTTNSIYHIRDKLEMRAIEQRRVYPAVPDDLRDADLLFED